ncbi:hypothetical protein BD410DRAFT_830829 [Rickenella mellea]|uniref:Uncharacterized protein n=1 Tax=Rickenella mellea TaxID=50990 RepID=A0A4Y7PT08_9AGAM|nr:hypothetical protein BD410DRAFT_830829 [Rickenella mellea]
MYSSLELLYIFSTCSPRLSLSLSLTLTAKGKAKATDTTKAKAKDMDKHKAMMLNFHAFLKGDESFLGSQQELKNLLRVFSATQAVQALELQRKKIEVEERLVSMVEKLVVQLEGVKIAKE